MEELCHLEWTLRCQKPTPGPVSLPADQEAEFSATSPAPVYLPAATLPTVMLMDSASQTLSKPPIKCLPS